MKQIISIALLALLLGLAVKAQERNNSIGINLGAAIPFSDFAMNSFEDENPGFAGPGANLELEFLSFGNGMTGTQVTAGYSWISFDEGKYSQAYSDALSQPGFEVRAGDYQLMTFCVGIVFRTQNDSRFKAMLIPRIGALIMWHPEISVRHDEYGTINQLSASTGYSTILGISLRGDYAISEKTGIWINYSASMASPYFEDVSGITPNYVIPVRYHVLGAGIYFNIRGGGK